MGSTILAPCTTPPEAVAELSAWTDAEVDEWAKLSPYQLFYWFLLTKDRWKITPRERISRAQLAEAICL